MGVAMGLPIYSQELKTGKPYAVFSFNWRLRADFPIIPYYRLFGNPALINERTKLPNSPSGNGWGSDVPISVVKAAGIEIRGKRPEAKEEPAS